jgi:hypothetical protein
MVEQDLETNRAPSRSQPTLRVVGDAETERLDHEAAGPTDPPETCADENHVKRLLEGLEAVEERTHALVARVDHLRADLRHLRHEWTATSERAPARSRSAARLLGRAVIVWTLLLELWAERTRYGLRVIADTPTYMELLRSMALRPFHSPPSVFGAGQVNLAHAAPDVQLLAFVWRWLAENGQVGRDLIGVTQAYELLALKGALVTLLIFHALYLWARRVSGSSRTAWLAVAVLPFVWGPALVISPGDLSAHGFMSTADHGEQLAIALLLYALLALDAELSVLRFSLATLAVSAVMVTHPFTGVRLAGLAASLAVFDVVRGGRRWRLTPPALVGGFLLASLWPAYDLSQAMVVGGFDGRALVGVLALLPLFAYLILRLWPAQGRLLSAARGLVGKLDSDRATLALALLGLLLTAALAGREIWLLAHPDPFLSSNRRALYWNGVSLPFWPLLIAPALAGLVGMARLARRGQPLPLLWALGCLAIGAAGAGGLPVPLWHRFSLFAQVPFAIGVAALLAERRWLVAHRIAVGTLVCSAAFAFCTLVFLPTNVTYFRDQVQAGWNFNRFLPQGSPVLVASDPASSYFVLPLGDRTLTLTTWHLTSATELPPARRGYLLMHRLYLGEQMQATGQEMWRRGVRYIVANRGVKMQLLTLDRFSSFGAPYVIESWADLAEVDAYIARLGRIATPLGHENEYYFFELDRRKLFPKAVPTGGPANESHAAASEQFSRGERR